MIEAFLKHGIFGWKPLVTIFNMDVWLAFWGSYLGGGLTIIAILVSIRLNKINLKKELEKEKRHFEQELEKQRIAFENKLKIEKIILEENKLREIYDEILRDIDALYFTLAFDIPTSFIEFENKGLSFNQIFNSILNEIAYFYRKYYYDRHFKNLTIFIKEIAYEFNIILHDSRREVKEK